MKAKFVKEIIVNDPDGGTIEMSLFKHENGGMFAIDSSYIVQVLPEEGDCWIPDPFSDHHNIETNYVVKLTGV